MKNLREWNEPFILGYTKCKAFCWFSRWSDKRSFSILSKTKAICPKDAGLSLLSWGGKKRKIKIWAKPSNIWLWEVVTAGSNLGNCRREFPHNCCCLTRTKWEPARRGKEWSDAEFWFFFSGWGRTVGRPMYWRDKRAFCFFFLKRKWGVPFCLLFLKEDYFGIVIVHSCEVREASSAGRYPPFVSILSFSLSIEKIVEILIWVEDKISPPSDISWAE